MILHYEINNSCPSPVDSHIMYKTWTLLQNCLYLACVRELKLNFQKKGAPMLSRMNTFIGENLLNLFMKAEKIYILFSFRPTDFGPSQNKLSVCSK